MLEHIYNIIVATHDSRIDHFVYGPIKDECFPSRCSRQAKESGTGSVAIEVPRFRVGSAIYSLSTKQRQINNDLPDLIYNERFKIVEGEEDYAAIDGPASSKQYTPSPTDGATAGEYSYIDPQLLRDLSQKRLAAITSEKNAGKNDGKQTQPDIYSPSSIASGDYAYIDPHLQRSHSEKRPTKPADQRKDSNVGGDDDVNMIYNDLYYDSNTRQAADSKFQSSQSEKIPTDGTGQLHDNKVEDEVDMIYNDLYQASNTTDGAPPNAPRQQGETRLPDTDTPRDGGDDVQIYSDLYQPTSAGNEYAYVEHK